MFTKNFSTAGILSLAIHLSIFAGLAGLYSPGDLPADYIEVVFVDKALEAEMQNPEAEQVLPSETKRAKIKTKKKKTAPRKIQARATTDQLPSLRSQYINRLRSEIETLKIYPRVAKKLKQTGRVVVQLRVLRNGDVVDHRILEDSPHRRLNEAAFQLISKIKHTEPIPKELALNSWDVVVPIEYKMR